MLRLILPLLALLVIASPDTVGMGFSPELLASEMTRALMAGLLLLPTLRRITGI